MINTRLVKVRRNIKNKDVSIGVPTIYKDEIDDEYFECSMVGGSLLYRPVNTSETVQVVQTGGPADQQQTHRRAIGSADNVR